MIVQQKTTYQQGTWPIKLIHGQSERSQVPQHRLVSRGNPSARIVTCSYY
jgi:hypothetical protein